MSMGTNLLLALHRRGMTQTELAARVGCSQSVISQYISGTRKPSMDKLLRMVEVLGVTANDLIGGEAAGERG